MPEIVVVPPTNRHDSGEVGNKKNSNRNCRFVSRAASTACSLFLIISNPILWNIVAKEAASEIRGLPYLSNESLVHMKESGIVIGTHNSEDGPHAPNSPLIPPHMHTCQSLSFKDQIGRGATAFHIAVREKDGMLSNVHGLVDLNKPFEESLNELVETITLKVKEGDNPQLLLLRVSNRDIENRKSNAWSKSNGHGTKGFETGKRIYESIRTTIPHVLMSNITTLGELSTAKGIVILFDSTGLPEDNDSPGFVFMEFPHNTVSFPSTGVEIDGRYNGDWEDSIKEVFSKANALKKGDVLIAELNRDGSSKFKPGFPLFAGFAGFVMSHTPLYFFSREPCMSTFKIHQCSSFSSLPKWPVYGFSSSIYFGFDFITPYPAHTAGRVNPMLDKFIENYQGKGTLVLFIDFF